MEGEGETWHEERSELIFPQRCDLGGERGRGTMRDFQELEGVRRGRREEGCLLEGRRRSKKRESQG